MDGDVVEDAQHVDNTDNDNIDKDVVVAGAGGEDVPEAEQRSSSIIHSDSTESDVAAHQHKSTSSLTVKLNKLNCESHCGDDPQPGPSNSAADFDLEVVNSLDDDHES